MIVQVDVVYGIGAGRTWSGDLESAPASVLSPGDEANVESVRDFARMMMAEQFQADITDITGTVSVARLVDARRLAEMHMADGHTRYDTGQCELCRDARALLGLDAPPDPDYRVDAESPPTRPK